ncbi:MlaD family protein [Nocardia sp. NBC_00565]|uniref:MlaD family protein n=1 Tax=Nocardia sp. NBC_00565 TaxID=2975993 RepID=UPI002E8010CD|nr:MlaD family protein [Nocardia sp. NBC_00565]WUC05569.1 MlaD family protein [Nocardia sp. NBC_00565]
MNLRTGISITGLLAIAASAVLYMNQLGLGVGVSERPQSATMVVPDTNGLVIGSKVLLRGISIGEVASMTATADGVEIAWNYRKDYRIPVQSRFRIDSLSALGEAYVAVLPTSESGPYLGDHARIPAAAITVPATIQDLSARLTRLLDQIQPEQVRDILKELDTALPNEGLVLVDLSRAWSLFADMTLDRADDLTTVLTKFQALLADSSWVAPGLAGSTEILRKFGQDMGSWLNNAVVTTDVAPLPEGIADGTGPFIDQLQRFLDKVAPDLKILGVAVLPSVRAAAAAMQTVDIATLLDNAIADSAGGSVTVHVSVPEGN